MPAGTCGRAIDGDGRVWGSCGRPTFDGICGRGDGIGRAIGICGRFMFGDGRAIGAGEGLAMGIAGRAPPAPTWPIDGRPPPPRPAVGLANASPMARHPQATANEPKSHRSTPDLDAPHPIRRSFISATPFPFESGPF